MMLHVTGKQTFTDPTVHAAVDTHQLLIDHGRDLEEQTNDVDCKESDTDVSRLSDSVLLSPLQYADENSTSETKVEERCRTEQRGCSDPQKKQIYISYSLDASFSEKHFVHECVNYLKRRHLDDHIWFDVNECPVNSPFCYISRFAAMESARAVVLFFSDCYLSDSSDCISILESQLLLQRIKRGDCSLVVFLVIYKRPSDMDAQRLANLFNAKVYDLTCPEFLTKSLSERAKLTGRTLANELVKLPFVEGSSRSETSVMHVLPDWRFKRMCQWSNEDLIMWLSHIGIQESYRELFRERVRSDRKFYIHTVYYR